MRALLQRVKEAHVCVGEEETGRIGMGLLILLGVKQGDTEEQARALAAKSALLRIFQDDAGKMNRSVLDAGGSVLVVSQFTLYADTRKGRRPSFIEAAPPELANTLYLCFVEALRAQGLTVATGRFQAEMEVHLVNAGPVTLLLES
jgi:D-tyrosyl-tRNA(Tyr) deacylase